MKSKYKFLHYDKWSGMLLLTIPRFWVLWREKYLRNQNVAPYIGEFKFGHFFMVAILGVAWDEGYAIKSLFSISYFLGKRGIETRQDYLRPRIECRIELLWGMLILSIVRREDDTWYEGQGEQRRIVKNIKFKPEFKVYSLWRGAK